MCDILELKAIDGLVKDEIKQRGERATKANAEKVLQRHGLSGSYRIDTRSQYDTSSRCGEDSLLSIIGSYKK